MKKITFLITLCFLFSLSHIFPLENNTKKIHEPENLQIFRKAYPDIIFNSEYDESQNDWKITILNNNKKFIFYWNNGSFIPPEEMIYKNEYWTLLYNYDYKKPLIDPSTYSNEKIEHLKNFSSAENRKNGKGTPMFFFDAIYDSFTRASVEKHIVNINFLGFSVNVHERLVTPLSEVEKRINQEASKDAQIKVFLKTLNKNEGYFWRIIAGTNRKSFHSLGIALDIQPKSYNGKEVYWSWAKDKNPKNWMFTKLSDRWMPPQKIIDIFEEEGFIWGGKWTIWDNMHFEYHPELILFNKEK